MPAKPQTKPTAADFKGQTTANGYGRQENQPPSGLNPNYDVLHADGLSHPNKTQLRNVELEY